MDTIFALATPRGKAGVAVIRISGPDAHLAAVRLAGLKPAARQATLRKLRTASGAVLDEALVLLFEGNQSFTGEPVVEFQTHGSLAVIDAVLSELADIPEMRLAEPGEFTRQALLNGRMDLSQVEGLGDLIEAETELQRQQAQRLFEGEIGQKVDRWRRDLIHAVALLEASIDFADEDVPEDVRPEVKERLQRVHQEMNAELAGADVAERIRDGFQVAIVGPPNIGKSTLLNYLAGREAAITSEVAGTTRDIIEVRMSLSGLPVTFLDTAGLRDTDDIVESIGVERALQRANAADLRVVLSEDGIIPEGLEFRERDLKFIGKADLEATQALSVSGLTGEGVQELTDQVTRRLEKLSSGAAATAHFRQRVALQNGCEALSAVLTDGSLRDMEPEILSNEVRSAIHALDSLIGRVDVEDVLDVVFASFCLGK